LEICACYHGVIKIILVFHLALAGEKFKAFLLHCHGRGATEVPDAYFDLVRLYVGGRKPRLPVTHVVWLLFFEKLVLLRVYDGRIDFC